MIAKADLFTSPHNHMPQTIIDQKKNVNNFILTFIKK